VSSAELVLSYERSGWRAQGPSLDLIHRDLRGLEALIEARLALARTPRRVHLRFDTSSLPIWLRQYHAHYCNYVLNLPPRGADGAANDG
jgi:Family of unknown function (DUF5395)